MASGTLNFDTNNQYIKGKIEYSESNKNNEKNVSSVTAIVYLRRTNTYYGLTASYQCNFYLKIDGTEFKIVNSGYVEIPSNNSWVEVGRATKTILHDNDGSKKISIETYASVTYSNFGYGTKTFSNISLDKLNRKSVITDFNNFDVEKEFKINVTKYSSNFNDTLQIKCNNTVVKTINNYITSNIQFSESELNQIFNIMKNVNTIEFKAVVTTKSGSTTLGTSEKNAKGSIYNADPVLNSENVTYKDTNDKTVNITEDNSYIIQNNSDLLIVVGAAVASKGASINEYKVTVNNETKTSDASGNFDFGKINSAIDLIAEITVTDSRNNKVTVKKNIKMVEYYTPKISVDLKRLNNYEDTTYVTANADIPSILNKNTILALQVFYRKIGDEMYASKNLENSIQSSINCDKKFQWEFYFTVIDRIGTYNFYGYSISKGVFPFFVDLEKSSIGINKFPKNNNSLETDGEIYLNENCKLYYDSAKLCCEIFGTKFILAEVKGNG